MKSKQKIFALFAVVCCLASPVCLGSKVTLEFSCSWDNNKPIDILVTPSLGIATRSDGGKDYQIIKITKWAVWLEVYEPNNQAGLKIQMIQRAEATNGKGGKWVDVVHSVTGNVSPIVGGTCWEK